MNDLSHTIRKTNRFELKYVITLQQAELFKSVLRTYLVPDEHGNNDGRYVVASLYYDSPDRRCYWEKEAGLKFRRKLRIRHYETGEDLTEETPVFLEIKQRVDRVTQKRRAILPYGEAQRLCDDRQIPDHAPGDRPFIEEVFVFLWRYNLHPASIVRYDRQAFIGTEYDIGLRVTFDTLLSFQCYPLDLREQRSVLPMLSANLVVMEIKVNERIPHWLTEMIAAHDLRLVRVSKYCRSIEAAQSMPSTAWRYRAAACSQKVRFSPASVLSALEQRIGIRGRKREVSHGTLQYSRSDQ